MSRQYEMRIQVKDYDKKNENDIIEVIGDNWNVSDNINIYDGTIQCGGQDNLCGGESEEEFADRLSRAIWRVNKGACLVAVYATYLEELPYETYIRDAHDYKQWKKNENEEQE